jgi:hypothetical protein
MKVSTNVPMGPDSRLHHIGLGVQLAGTPVSLLINDRHIRVIHRHDYQPRGLPPDHPRALRAAHRPLTPITAHLQRPQPRSRLARATRTGIGLDRGEDDATITNRGHPHPEMISNQQPENATMSRDAC